MGLPKAICSLYHIPAAALLRTGSRLVREALVFLFLFFLPVELLIPDADVTIQELAEKSQQQAEHLRSTFPTTTF